MVNLHAVFDGWDVPDTQREQTMTRYKTSPWKHRLCLQRKNNMRQNSM